MIYYKHYVYKAQNSSIFLSINEKKKRNGRSTRNGLSLLSRVFLFICWHSVLYVLLYFLFIFFSDNVVHKIIQAYDT